MHHGNRRHIDMHHILHLGHFLNAIYWNPCRHQTILEATLNPHSPCLQFPHVRTVTQAQKGRNEASSVYHHRFSITALSARFFFPILIRQFSPSPCSPSSPIASRFLLTKLAHQHPCRCRQLRSDSLSLRTTCKGNHQQKVQKKDAFHIGSMTNRMIKRVKISIMSL